MRKTVIVYEVYETPIEVNINGGLIYPMFNFAEDSEEDDSIIRCKDSVSYIDSIT